jgi:hypothetical protein
MLYKIFPNLRKGPEQSVRFFGFIFLVWYFLLSFFHIDPNLLHYIVPSIDLVNDSKSGPPFLIICTCFLADLTGIAGALCLIQQTKKALPVFLTMLVFTLIYQSYIFNFTPEKVTNIDTLILPILTVIFTMGLVWYSHIASENEWIH